MDQLDVSPLVVKNPLRRCGFCGADSRPVEGEAFDACPMCERPWDETECHTQVHETKEKT